MSRTDWTPEMESRLCEAVDRALAAGLHKTQGPKRGDNLYVGFWTAVAVMMADSPDSPTAGACAKRWPIARENKEANSITEELAKFDDFYEEYDVDPYAYLASEVDELKGIVTWLAEEWGYPGNER